MCIGTPTSEVWGVAQRRGGFCVHGCEFQRRLIVVGSRMALPRILRFVGCRRRARQADLDVGVNGL